MLTSRRCPPAPPPPPPRRPRRRLARDVSLASLSSDEFQFRARYRCCCRRVHLKTASFLIAALDIVSMTGAFARGVYIGLSMQHNPMAISWFVASSLIFILGIFCILSMVYSVYRELHLCMLPMLVLKAFTLLVCIATAVALIYMMIGHNQYLLDLVAEHVTKSDYDEARTALRFGGGGLVLGFSLMALAQGWFLRVLYRCYGYLQDKFLWTVCRAANGHSETATAQSCKDENIGNGRSSTHQSLDNGHRAGPTASVSNCTALTELAPGPHWHNTPISSPSSQMQFVQKDVRNEELANNCCYGPIACDAISDREHPWKTYDHTNV